MQFGTVTGPLLNGVAADLEQLGYDTVLFADSQCRAPDVWTALGAASAETQRVTLGPGVTNTVTRDVAVTASAVASLQQLTEGRALLPIGRGDSAAHFIGRKPEPIAEFDAKMAQLRRYLRFDTVRRGDIDSKIEWLPLVEQYGDIPIELVPSGPKVANIAAKYADRISFAIGSNPDYISDFLTITKQQIEAAGRDPSTIKFGAWINVVLCDDQERALDAVRGTTGIWARFSLMRPDQSRLPEPLRNALSLLQSYDMNAFGSGAATDATTMPNEFVDWFSVAGDSEHVYQRLAQLNGIGLDYLYLVPGELGFQDEIGSASIARVATEVLPRLRGTSSATQNHPSGIRETAT